MSVIDPKVMSSSEPFGTILPLIVTRECHGIECHHIAIVVLRNEHTTAVVIIIIQIDTAVFNWYSSN